MWVEVNSRVNCPIKSALNSFVEREQLDMAARESKFAVSWVTCKVAKIGLQRFVRAWNCHCVPKKGCPIDLMQSKNRTIPITNAMTKEEAAGHANIHGRQLTWNNVFGVDPFGDNIELKSRRLSEILKKCSFENIFSDIQL